MRLGDRPDIADSLASAGEVVRLDEDHFEIWIKRAKNRDPLPLTFSLIPTGPVGIEVLRASIARYVGAVLDRQEDRYAAVTGILRRDYPRFPDLNGIGDDPDEVARAIDAIARLDRSHLLIQGPPGAGKTLYGLSCDRRNACPREARRGRVTLAKGDQQSAGRGREGGGGANAAVPRCQEILL